MKVSEEEYYDYAFISQSRISRKLFERAVQIAERNTDLKFTYCKHPDEVFHCRKQKIPLNLELYEGDSIQAMSSSRGVVGVYSSALYEALALNKEVWIVPIDGYEFMQREIDLGYFNLINDANTFSDVTNASTSDKKSFMHLLYGTNEEQSSAFSHPVFQIKS